MADPCLTAPVEGQKLRRDGKLLSAHERFAVCARNSCPAEVVQACARWAHEVEAAIPSVVISVRDEEGHDLPGGQMSIDGEASTPIGVRAVELDPGEHRVIVERADKRHEERVVLREGEKNRMVTVTFPSRRPAPKPSPTPLPPPPQPWWTPMRVAGVTIGATGVVVTSVGGALALFAKRDYDDARSSCANGAVDDCPASAVTAADSARSRATAATVVIIAGAFAFATGGALVLLGGPATRDRASRPAVHVGLGSIGVTQRW